MKSALRFGLLLLITWMPMVGQVPETKIASGVVLKITENQRELHIKSGMDAYGKEMFSIGIVCENKINEIKVTDAVGKRIKKSLDGIRMQKYELTAQQPLWAFDSVLVDIEIIQGIKRLHRVDVLDECGNTGRINEIRSIVGKLVD